MTSFSDSPSSPPARTLDLVRPFTFVFQDAEWLKKTLLGGLFVLAGVLVVGHFFVLGYLARLVRNVVASVPRPLPEWDDLGELFVEGVKYVLILVIYWMPVVILALLIVIPAAVAGGHDSELPPPALTALVCLVLPLCLLIMIVLPVALVHAAVTNRFGAAFEIGKIVGFIKANFVNYLLAIVVYFVAHTLSQVGIVLFCVGVVFTSFLGTVMAAYAFADAYRLGKTS